MAPCYLGLIVALYGAGVGSRLMMELGRTAVPPDGRIAPPDCRVVGELPDDPLTMLEPPLPPVLGLVGEFPEDPLIMLEPPHPTGGAHGSTLGFPPV